MFVHYILIKFTLITCVVGIINVDYFNKEETESKLVSLERNINLTLYKLESNNLDRLITYINGQTEALTKKIPEIEAKIPEALNATKNEIEKNLIDKISQIINVSNKKIEENLEKKITQALNASNKKNEETLDEKIKQFDEKITQKWNITKKELLREIRISNELPCKEESLKTVHDDIPFYSMDNDTFNHVTLKRDSTGHLMNFVIHIAIEANKNVRIYLINKENYSVSDIKYFIDVGDDNNQNTKLFQNTKSTEVQHTSTPNILSTTQFRAFYVKIDNGKLEFGREGDSDPLISYYNEHFKSVNYFLFGKFRSGMGKIRYDCPAPVK